MKIFFIKIVLVVLCGVFLSACKTTYETCPAYGQAESVEVELDSAV